jgi:MFS family permease
VPFLILGGLVGVAVAAVVAYGLPGDESFDRGSVFGFFLVMFGAGGAILGAIAALLLDRRSVKRQQRAIVEAVPDSEPDDGTQP